MHHYIYVNENDQAFNLFVIFVIGGSVLFRKYCTKILEISSYNYCKFKLQNLK